MRRVILSATAGVMLFAMGCDGDSTSYDVKTMTRTVHFLTNTNGMSLYEFDNDTKAVSNCVGDCLKIWPILSGSASGSDISVIDSTTSHLAYRGAPLYYFASDASSGDMKGDEVKGVWHLVFPASSFTQESGVKLSTTAVKQSYLSDSDGKSLYVFDNDTANTSNCYDDCEAKWPVFYSESLDILPSGLAATDFGTITRSNGTKQTTYKGKPLYYFFQDSKAGDTTGDWVNGIWHLVEIN